MTPNNFKTVTSSLFSSKKRRDSATRYLEKTIRISNYPHVGIVGIVHQICKADVSICLQGFLKNRGSDNIIDKRLIFFGILDIRSLSSNTTVCLDSA
jgi:hypothetical protein